jgi:hypothetical protein
MTEVQQKTGRTDSGPGKIRVRIVDGWTEDGWLDSCRNGSAASPI